MSEPAANDDLELLRQFTRDHSQAAFTALVQRHVNLVYSAALRQVRSPQLAEEIAQSTFADLARNAAKLTNTPEAAPVLAAWLYQVARHTAVDVVRKESRRQLREQIAVEMNAMNATEASWTEIEPLLDEAVAALDETDRAAVLLRYFENQSLRAVGQQLRVSDDAAQKRVSRAVEQLREFFAKRGVSVGAGGLVVVISANAVQAAPVGLAVTISAAALAGTAATTSTIIAATTKTIAMTTLQKTLVTATVAVLAGAGIYQSRQAAQLRDQVQTLQQQQAPLVEQIQQLQNNFADATNRLGGLLADNTGLKPNPNQNELLKLRGEVGVLRQQAQEAEQKLTDFLSVESKFKKNQNELSNKAKQIGLAMIMYSADNDGPLPTGFMQITNYFRGGVETLSKMSVYDFDLVNMDTNGLVAGLNSKDILKSEHPDMVVLRERRARQSPDGIWSKIYGYLDGRVVVATSYDGNFDAWERVNTYSPPPNRTP